MSIENFPILYVTISTFTNYCTTTNRTILEPRYIFFLTIVKIGVNMRAQKSVVGQGHSNLQETKLK
jgi:hypothetical protein